jgi:hypothetical protein
MSGNSRTRAQTRPRCPPNLWSSRMSSRLGVSSGLAPKTLPKERELPVRQRLMEVGADRVWTRSHSDPNECRREAVENVEMGLKPLRSQIVSKSLEGFQATLRGASGRSRPRPHRHRPPSAALCPEPVSRPVGSLQRIVAELLDGSDVDDGLGAQGLKTERAGTAVRVRSAPIDG